MRATREVYVIQPGTQLQVLGARWQGQKLCTKRSAKTKYGEELRPGEVDEAFLFATCVVIDGQRPEPRVSVPLGAIVEVPGLGRFRIDAPGFCGGDSCVLTPVKARAKRAKVARS